MCGIAGGWWTRHTQAAASLPQALHAMRHRGPDDQGLDLLPMGSATVGLAIMIALMFDSLLDPIMGQVSDNWRSRWGRRHPFMYAAALPVAASYLLLWNRPQDWSHGALFVYLIVVAVIGLALSVSALALGGRDHGGIRWLCYGMIAAIVFYLWAETIGSILGTSGFFLVAALVAGGLALAVVRVEKLLARKGRTS